MTEKGRVRGTKKVHAEGEIFHSRREYKRWKELRLLEMAGEITNLERQVEIGLEGKDDAIRTPTGKVMRYIADFRYFDRKLGITVIEDAKGAYHTDVFKMKNAILKAMGIEVKIV